MRLALKPGKKFVGGWAVNLEAFVPYAAQSYRTPVL